MRNTLYKPLGFFFLALAVLGAVLPLLPTTPFVLLAAWFFARSSPRWHDYLHRSELFGPMLRNWEQQRCISCRTKQVALASMLLAGTASIIFGVNLVWLKWVGAGFITLGCITVLSLKTCP